MKKAIINLVFIFGGIIFSSSAFAQEIKSIHPTIKHQSELNLNSVNIDGQKQNLIMLDSNSVVPTKHWKLTAEEKKLILMQQKRKSIKEIKTN